VPRAVPGSGLTSKSKREEKTMFLTSPEAKVFSGKATSREIKGV
jgi:hypothetical protein